MSEKKKNEVPVWTWRDAIRKAKVPPLTKHVCNCIANYVSDVGEGAFPSVRTLMSDSGMSNRSVATHLANAEAAGLLKIEREEAGGDGRFRRSVYYPRFPDEAVLQRQAKRISTRDNDEPDPEDDPSGEDDHVKELHVDRPSEGASPGGRVNLVHEPREPGAEYRVKEVHANSPLQPTTELPTHSSVEDDEPDRVCVNFGKLVEDIHSEGGPYLDVLELFIGPLWGAKQRPKVPDLRVFMRELRDGLGRRDFDVATLQRARQLASETRTVMPALPECLAFCETAKRAIAAERAEYARQRQAELRRTTGHAGVDPATAARSEALRERLKLRLGRDVFESWFRDLECERIEGATLTVSVAVKFRKNWISSHYRDDLEVQARAEFGTSIGRVDVVLRGADGRPSA